MYRAGCCGESDKKSMTARFVRVPLSVEAVFQTDGRLKPKKLFFDGVSYPIERILSLHRRRPPGIACIAPLEYVVMIDGKTKMIYYEAESGTWFSVKEAKQ